MGHGLLLRPGRGWVTGMHNALPHGPDNVAPLLGPQGLLYFGNM
jgi:hypothetical protein